MAKNEVYRIGERLSLEVGPGVLAGEPVQVGFWNAVAVTDEGGASTNLIKTGNEANYASCMSTGVWRLPVVITTSDKLMGTKIYAITNGTNKKVTLTDVAASHTLFGLLHETGVVGTSNLEVLIVNPAI